MDKADTSILNLLEEVFGIGIGYSAIVDDLKSISTIKPLREKSYVSSCMPVPMP